MKPKHATMKPKTLKQDTLPWNPKTMKTKNDKKYRRPVRPTVVLLWRNSEDTEYGAWRITTYKGDIIPMSAFVTAAAARDYAASKNWGIRRARNCDV